MLLTLNHFYFSTYSGTEIEWTYPDNPQFIVDGMSMNDIKQNGIGDCWFLASLASLAQRNERVSFVIQKQRNEQATPDMGYMFKFFRMGAWKTYKVDKYLPTQIAAIAGDNEWWVPYCEKAYAKAWVIISFIAHYNVKVYVFFPKQLF